VTRYEIALNKIYEPVNFYKSGPECVSRKKIILKSWGSIFLEKSPCSATCGVCKKIIPASVNRFRVLYKFNDFKKIFRSVLFHIDCLPMDIMKIIQEKEKEKPICR
jgi:hypothetical protein